MMDAMCVSRNRMQRARSLTLLAIVLLPLAAGHLPAAAETAEQRMTARLHSAQNLTRSANELNQQAQILKRDVDILLLASNMVAENSPRRNFDLEVREVNDAKNIRRVAPESKAVLENYDALRAKYKAALSAYLQHRQQVQQHAAEFHAQAQLSNQMSTIAPVTSVPNFKVLETAATQACMAFQGAESALKVTEEQLFSDIQYLMAKKKTLPAETFLAAWKVADSTALQLQQRAGALHNMLLEKDETIETNEHAKMSQAMRDGDYVESQKVYGQNEQNSALLNEESNRANKHTAVAVQFINELQGMISGGSSSTAGDGNFVQDDQSLAAEFEQVQKLYSEVQDAAPKFHK